VARDRRGPLLALRGRATRGRVRRGRLRALHRTPRRRPAPAR
jgi:hypothetical protein